MELLESYTDIIALYEYENANDADKLDLVLAYIAMVECD